MHLVRGNHESKNMNRIYGFEVRFFKGRVGEWDVCGDI